LNTGRGVVLAAAAVWCLPALSSLIRQSWQSEAGSIAPIILGLGGWTLFRQLRETEGMAEPVTRFWPLLALTALLLLYLLAAAIDMTALLALLAWGGCVLGFYATYGWKVAKVCAFPLAFVGLIVPLPYSVSLPLTLRLREAVAEWSTDLARVLGMDVALERHAIIVGPYELAVESACAGLSSMVSLVGIGLLYAFWMRRGGWRRMVAIVALSVPIAFAANVLRVVTLLALTELAGARVLDMLWHPFTGVLSFLLALGLLWLTDTALFGRSTSPPESAA
jgi:exosortase